MTPATRPRRVLIIVENLPVPFDTRVWNEATALAADGYQVSVICPAADGFEQRFEVMYAVKFGRRGPMHVMEYMALGRPLVQFETTEGRFSARDAALYARPNDARDLADKLLGLLADPDRRRAMGAAGRERVRSALAWEHQAVKLLAACDAAFGVRP